MSDTPRTDAIRKPWHVKNGGHDYCHAEDVETIERELASADKERMKYRERAWRAESQLEQRYGLHKEISAELGLADETGDDALRKGLETIKALKEELNGLKAKFKAAFEMEHDWNGLCPDSDTGMSSRDPDCPACKALTEVMN